MDAGTYKITNNATGRVYIGGSLHVNARIVEHQRELVFDRHNNRVLQADWNAQGESEFVFEVIERFIDPSDAYHAEKRLLDELGTAGVPMYNLRFGGHHSVERPQAVNEPKTVSLSVSIDTHLYDTIREIVDGQREKEITWGRRGLSEWIRQACCEKLERDVPPT